MSDDTALDGETRLFIYEHFARSGVAPTVARTAEALRVRPAAVEAAYDRLAATHALVLHPGTRDIWMAMPFSAVPTTFRVEANGRAYWANCAWDALGIPAALASVASDARITAQCGDCGEPLTLAIAGGALVRTDALCHFAVPAARWWDDIGDT